MIDGKWERLTPSGDADWRVRLTADEVGKWSWQLIARDRSGQVQSTVHSLSVIAGRDPGFVGRSSASPGMFAFNSAGGKPYFAVGENMCWAGDKGTFDFDTWLRELSDSGGNWIRIWMNNGHTMLEAMPKKGDKLSATSGFHGLGMYALDHAWALDRILDEAESRGIYSMLCFGTYGEFNTGGYFNEGQWPVNPYNVVNGGPCKVPMDFWSNLEAKRYYQRRLRYIAARYGYRTHVHSWEFFNEANPTPPWVAEMADFLKGSGKFAGLPADPYHHLVSTTYGSDAIWKLNQVDFTMSHNYGTGNIPDHAPVIYVDALEHRKYDKPHFMAEFGIDWRVDDRQYDPKGLGINLHNGIWSALVSGSAGTGMIWYWDNYVSPLHVYKPFVAASKFAAQIPWTAAPWSPLKFAAPVTHDQQETFTDLIVYAGEGWGKVRVFDYKIGLMGVQDHLPVSQFLYSPAKPELRTVPVFRVNYARAGKFSVRVTTVSGSSKIRFLIDGAIAREVALDAAPPKDGSKPAYESTNFVKEYSVYQALFNKEFSVDVPSGAHLISLDNVDGDWASIDKITLTNYRSSRYPELNLYGSGNGREAIIWAENARHNWKNVADKQDFGVIRGATSEVLGLSAGRYVIEWWNTETGEVISKDKGVVTSSPAGLKLHFPVVATDIAARMYKEQ